MTETAHLIVKVSAQGTNQIPRELDKVAASAGKAERATYSLTKVWIAAAAAAAGLVVGGRKVFEVGKQFESLNAQLKTATGTAENAAIAFEAIQRFAAQTPYDLAQATDAFIKLTNLGLTPSERALRAYGDTASAMGKTLEEAVNAVARAVAGEFEPLKSFGVQARKEGELLRFTFRGVTTEVDNTAAAIEEYFQTLGEDNFTGAMAERMATLEGKASNLADAWDVLFAEISKAGVGDLIKQGIDGAIVAINELTAMVSSGQLAAYLRAIGQPFLDLWTEIRFGISQTGDYIRRAFQDWGFLGSEAAEFIGNAFLVLPKTISSAMQLAGVEIGIFFTRASTELESFTDFAKNVGKTGGKFASSFFSNFTQRDFFSALNQIGSESSEIWSQFFDQQNVDFAKYNTMVEATTKAHEELTTKIGEEHNAAVAAFKEQIKLAGDLRDRFDAIQQAKSAFNWVTDFLTGGRGSDALAGFGVRGNSVSAEYTKLVESLQTQEQALMNHYQKRKELIMKNTADESAERKNSLALLDADFQRERSALLDRNKYEFDERVTTLEGQTQIELEIRETAYQAELAQLKNAQEAKLISEEEYYQRKEALERGHAKISADIVKQSLMQVQTQQLNAYGMILGMAGDISQQIQQVTEEGTTASKVAFAAAKAIAIAQAIVYTELAAIRAMAEGGIAGIPLSTAIRALGYTSVALMTATSIAEVSQHEHGGMIPAGRMGLVGEAGPEFIQGPAVVSSARTTQGLMQGQRGGGDVYVNVVNNSGGQYVAEVEERETERGREINVMFREVEQRLASAIRRGGTEIGRSIEETFGLGRGRVAT